MKLIEAMKRVKYNKLKIVDLQNKIAESCSNLSFETPKYGDETKTKISEWIQSCEDLSQENVKLLCAIQRTNLATQVTIELGGKQVTKEIAYWVWRKTEYAKLDFMTIQKLSDRNLKETNASTSTGNVLEVRIVRHFDQVEKDNKAEMYRSEGALIDSTLEIINAVTDLIEA